MLFPQLHTGTSCTRWALFISTKTKPTATDGTGTATVDDADPSASSDGRGDGCTIAEVLFHSPRVVVVDWADRTNQSATNHLWRFNENMMISRRSPVVARPASA
eukprot:NODE_10358_length_1358_cov_2.811535.p3 GENE.NODE_10358_length_1358_cov_2.811535~~NODE_10358_length_1358_cov_2.811535.p3  ORF type:complete len:104 (+),score=15.46 NODE_10358_length_1358_cov_2.811535:468-779(+)